MSRWDATEEYCNAKKKLKNLSVVNDAAERALGLATEVNNKTASRNEEQLQAMYKVVKGTRGKLRGMATSTETVTKKALSSSIEYNWK